MSQAENPSYEITTDDLNKVEEFSRTKEASVLVIFFDDMKGSTGLKQKITAVQDEEAFQTFRREHDALLTRIISRDGAGAVIKSTGDGLLAVFSEPSTAVERAVEIQEALHHHPYLSVRIGLDMGQVRVEAAGGTKRDLFGRHVDWAARAESLADGGHIIVTRSVYVDAFGWIPKYRVQWKEHGFYMVKEGEEAIEAFEPYNSNITVPMKHLRGRVVQSPASAETPRIMPSGHASQDLGADDTQAAASLQPQPEHTHKAPNLRREEVLGQLRDFIAPGRVLTTVLFVDMVGSTALLVALGDRHWREVRAQYTALVRQELARHGGEEINVFGDEILAVFDGAAAAIRCGCAIRDAMQGLGMAVKVGIHAGEVEYDGKTISGIAVHTGGRIRGAAQPGEVLVSNTVKDLVAGSGITFTDRGTHILRGLPGEWRLFTPNVPEANAPTS